MSNRFFASDQYETYKILRRYEDGRYHVYYVSFRSLFSNKNRTLDYEGEPQRAPISVSRVIKYFKIKNKLRFKVQSTKADGTPFVTNESDMCIKCFCCKQKIEYMDMITDPLDIPLYRSPQDVVYNKTFSVGSVLQEIPATPGFQAGFKIYDSDRRTISSNTNLVLYPGEEFCFYIVTVVNWRSADGVGAALSIDTDNGAFVDYEIRFN